MRELLLWARDKGITLGTVSVGTCTVQVLDLGMTRGKKPAKEPSAPSFLTQMAGARAKELAEAGVIPPLDDDEDEAAIS